MKILALSRPVTRPPAEFGPHLLDEARTLWSLHMADVVREQYLRSDGGVVLVLECPDLESAQANLEGLPLVANGLLQFDLWTLAPFTPWERLLDGQGSGGPPGPTAS